MRTRATATLRSQVIAALEKRAGAEHGDVRALLDKRIAALVADEVTPANPAAMESPSDKEGLAALVARLDNAAASRSYATPIVDAVDQFRKIWSTVRTESQLRQSMQQAPDNAGPLNSAALVHRSIARMRELSPGYLQHFLAYVDDLSAIEALLGNASAPKETARGPSVRKRAKSKPRAPKEGSTEQDA